MVLAAGLIATISIDGAPSFPDFLLGSLRHRCVSKAHRGSYVHGGLQETNGRDVVRGKYSINCFIARAQLVSV